MKILHLPLNVRGSEQVGQEKGFRAVFDEYQQLDYLNHEAQFGKEATNRELLRLCQDSQPDIIWAQIQETTTITPETWALIHTTYPQVWKTTWSGDARSYIPESLKQVLPYFAIFYNDTDQGALYRSICQRYEFTPIAVDFEEATNYDHPVLNPPEIVFVGNNYGATFSNGLFRLQVMEALTREFGNRFGVVGNSWPQSVNCVGNCEVKHQSAYYRQAKVIISVDHIAGILHWSERLIWALASGRPIVVQDQPKLSDHFGDHLNYFQTVEGCVEEVKALLALPEHLIESNIKLVQDHHTWLQRAQKVKEDYENRAKLAS